MGILTTEFQHVYRKRYSTTTALTQLTDNWLTIEDKKMVGVVLLDFTTAFYIIGHDLLLKKLECGWGVIWVIGKNLFINMSKF